MHAQDQLLTVLESEMASMGNYAAFEQVFSGAECSIQSLPLCLAEEVVKEIVNAIVEEEKCERSSSTCRSKWNDEGSSDEDVDPRLKCWHRMLRQRKRLQQRIQLQTGKRPEDVLFNRSATIDDREKQLMQRLLDYANRTNATVVAGKMNTKSTLRPLCHPELCIPMPELQASVPEPERDVGKAKKMSFIGLSQLAKLELADTTQAADTDWLRSKVLEERLSRYQDDIKRVLEFCPDVEGLQISPDLQLKKENKKSRYLGVDELLDMSTTSDSLDQPSEELMEQEILIANPEIVEEPSYALRINGHIFSINEKVSALNAEVELFFQCDPYQRSRKIMLELENMGELFIFMQWKLKPFYNIPLLLNKTENSEFLFDKRHFFLLKNQKRRIDVIYQPESVGVLKENWHLVISCPLFCNVNYVNISLHGECTAPAIYREKIDNNILKVLENSNLMALKTIPFVQARIAPIIQPPHLDCPYERIFDERESFNAQNPGYHCSRYSDLESLKELYGFLKKPREPAWDYSIETMRQFVLRNKDAALRVAFNKKLLEILQPMKCASFDLCPTLDYKLERDRTCLIYVRGLVGNTIESWEQLTNGLEAQCMKSELQRYVNELIEGVPTSEEAGLVDLERLIDETAKKSVLKKVRGLKFFKDTLYMQTYTLVCDAVEDIVSVIESTVHI